MLINCEQFKIIKYRFTVNNGRLGSFDENRITWLAGLGAYMVKVVVVLSGGRVLVAGTCQRFR
ncbi:MAG: hypothetical protein JKY66_00280 [Spongiibacteraceae bacterium]|nr:hypothetical protein [Spongiibacteraceae bacterium]